MRATVIVGVLDTTTYDTDLRRTVPTVAGVTCLARVQMRDVSDVVTGLDPVSAAPYLIQVPSRVLPTVGGVVEVVDCVDDESLTGRVLAIDAVGGGSERFTRDLYCTLTT